MTIEYNQSLLASIGSDDSVLVAAASEVNQLTELCKSGEISQDEYVELIADIQCKVNIQCDMNELKAMERLNTAITGLISIAKLV